MISLSLFLCGLKIKGGGLVINQKNLPQKSKSGGRNNSKTCSFMGWIKKKKFKEEQKKKKKRDKD